VLVRFAFALYSALRRLAYHRLSQLKEEQLVYVSRPQSQLIEAVQRVQTVKPGDNQADRQARVANASVEVARREAAIGRLTATFAALSKLVIGGQRVVLIWLCAWMTLEGRFSAGMLVVFVTYAELFATRTGSLIDKLVDLRLLGLHGARVADIALESPEPHVHGGYSGPAPDPRIEVAGVGSLHRVAAPR